MHPFFIGPSEPVASREAARDKLARDLRKFKRGGGKVEVLPAFGAPQKAWDEFVVRDSVARKKARKKIAKRQAAARAARELDDDFDDTDDVE